MKTNFNIFKKQTNNSMKKIFYISLIIQLLLIQNIFSQEKDNEVNIAEDLVYNEDFSNAIELYKKVLIMDSLNPVVNFELGFCYLNTILEKDKSIQYFEKAIDLYPRRQQKSIEYLETKFYLGRSYRVNYQFDKAIETLTELKEKVRNKKFKKVIDNEIELAQKGKLFIKKPISIEVNNLGKTINSSFSDHSPVFSVDESVLIFTSRRGYRNGEMLPDGQYDENIYISEKQENGLWSQPRSIGDNINTKMHEATIGLSYDGQQLFIYKDEDDGSIYVSNLKGDQWTTPKKLGDNINTRFRETHASLSTDGKKLYFTSDRPRGEGGLDIYVSELQDDGTWGEAKNMGKAVNTEKDEEGPYIHPDGKRLYFSSKGHDCIGGYDIFYSEINQFGTWSMAKNIGYPINTIEDDIFYTPTPDGQRAYYSSVKQKGLGKSDIYIMGLPEVMKTDLTIMSGKVTICGGGKLPESKIKITDNTTGEEMIAKPNSKTGKFIFIVKHLHNYTVTVEKDNAIIHNKTFDIPNNSPSQQVYESIRLDPTVPCDETLTAAVTKKDDILEIKYTDENGIVYDSFVEIENILFPFGKANKITKNKSLDELAKYLINNKEAVIEIGAYADSKGRATYNQKLSEQRANVVKKYLTNKGVVEKQLVTVGYGEENPITINKNKKGYWLSASQKYNRRIEFRMLNQGEETLLIRPMSNIPEQYKNPKYDKDYVKNKRNDIETKI